MTSAMSEADLIRKLGELLTKALKEEKVTGGMGACHYTQMGNHYCFECTKGYCDSFSGATWTAGAQCE
jgi:hypothetical protein